MKKFAIRSEIDPDAWHLVYDDVVFATVRTEDLEQFFGLSTDTLDNIDPGYEYVFESQRG